ncbi:FadR/GntR family transcriptional regulator [Corynebacterium liangguodongii]|uniref:GntR family transcriptional regulator n=1 Tax=Corynebacterium liangguodongii TaxID=2079535 RepID=A0A2S0WFM7_9CORY|nr:FCD domain-containing protein [Corynebacterium liangguodongii]AWB84587.1 GntR family transcriptional regulator [Corynebacterium liangguodongii]PWB98828.1 FadR family transcriptional regulator [Corynebacterium liangguodongii]
MTPARSTTTPSTEPLLNKILDTLGMEIISGTIAAGRTFTLSDLSTRFGISRTVAREVMRALEQLGLVVPSRRIGIKVLPSSHWNVFDQAVIDWRWRTDTDRQLRELSELRYSVEPIAAALAATKASEDEGASLVHIAKEMIELAEAGASEEFLALDIKFHTLILNASRNEMFGALAPSILHALEGRTRYGHRDSIPLEDSVRAHLTLAEAIVARDGARAERASREVMADIAP